MSDSPNSKKNGRLATLTREVQLMKDSLKNFTLVGALDRNSNHISSMQDEIDEKIREALAIYWLSDN